LEFSGAISRCSFQSFVPNPGIKGFSVPSGLGELFSKEVLLIYKIEKLEKKRKEKKRKEKKPLCYNVLVAKAKKAIYRDKKLKGRLRRYVIKSSEKNELLCEVHKNGVSGNKRIKINTNTAVKSYK
jgi:hypothetical protein